MATYIKILNPNDIKDFDTPPEFSSEERKRFFYLPNWANEFIETLRTPTNKTGFVVQLGYFKAVGKFFVARKFHRADVEFVAGRLNCNCSDLNFGAYKERTLIRHQEVICENMGVNQFEENAKESLKKEAINLASKQIKPRLMFMSLVDFLRNRKIEVPSYNTFAEIITEVLRNFEKSLVNNINCRLTNEDKHLLDELLEFGEEYVGGEKKTSKVKRYKLTLLKKINQSTKPSKIKSNIQDLQCLEPLFELIKPVIKSLNISSDLILYYAQIVIKSRGFQINRRESRKYLLLMAFVAYQYYRLNDVLTETLMKSVQSSINTTEREHKENFYNQRKEKNKELYIFSKKMTSHLAVIEQAKAIIHSQTMSANEKIENLTTLFSKDFDNASVEIRKQLSGMRKESGRITKNNDYYDILETRSLKLQNRVSEIIKNIKFDPKTSNRSLIQAIDHYKEKAGGVGSIAPVCFLSTEEQENLFNPDGKFRVSLYKILLFEKISDGIRSGALNIKYSYKYRAYDDYLISKNVWESDKSNLLEKAGLVNVQDFNELEKKLKTILSEQFKITNENITNGVNKYIKIKKDGSLIVKTPSQEKEESENIAIDLFPKNRIISLFEVLTTVNQNSCFIDCFEHWQIKHNRDKPADKTFFAGIIGNGCNLGIRKTAKISRNINLNELENTINWYFTQENILRANDKILSLLDRLQLPKLFKHDQNITHTGSDGQKYGVSVESLNANFSYKYFGKNQGVSVYSFIDDSHRLFYSTVINPAEREAAYVIDGLMHNDVVQSDIHSTDTHGFSEVIFAITYLLGISFAPRIKKFMDQHLYSFESPSELKSLGYIVLPKKLANTKITQEQWDHILRFIATIRLKENTASQLLKRLSSYSKQHPLYLGLKQLGRIIKSIFLLKYIDDLELRQLIEKLLNKIESSNKFGKAVFFGDNREFRFSTKEEQLIVEGCKRLIENSIICWNYLYLSQLIHETSSVSEKKDLITAIKNGSVVVWQHINLQGEYDFSDDILKNSIEFQLPDLLKVEVL